MSDQGPLFPKKTSEEGQQDAPPVVIERSDDPNFGKTTRRTPGSSLPQGKPMGCSTSSVFVVMLVVAIVVAGRLVM